MVAHIPASAPLHQVSTENVVVVVVVVVVEEACPAGLYHSGISCRNHQPI